jgi:acetylornithine deacetylase/succinyl-diaminopimelate desuccinylase-like protein
MFGELDAYLSLAADRRTRGGSGCETVPMPGEQLQERPAELLQRLLRFDTTNPPGDERECIAWIAGLLDDLAVEVKIVGKTPDRPNLIARLRGTGASAPLLLQGHVDVVAARGEWEHAPFAGDLEDGYVWGRGALDMKGGVAMMLAAFMRACANSAQPPGDVILCLLADEEAGSDLGANFLVQEHPELFSGVRHSIGEFGGFTMELAGKRLYPIMVAEKQVCWTRARVRGPAGHGSLPVRGGAAGKLGRLLAALDRKRLPVRVTPAARSMVQAIAAELPRPLALPLHGLLQPRLTDRLLDTLGERLALFDPLLHNTANANVISAGEKINVVPGEASVEIDCRMVPGCSPDELFAELRALGGVELELEVIRHDPITAEPDMTLFGTLGETLRELDGRAKPIPMLLPGATDGRFFAKLGIQTYGFLPMPLPPELNFMRLIHAENERVPVEAVEFGTNAIGRVLERF